MSKILPFYATVKIGSKFGDVEVVSGPVFRWKDFPSGGETVPFFFVSCKCGTVFETMSNRLKGMKACIKCRNLRFRKSRITHGGTRRENKGKAGKLYRLWCNIRRRCDCKSMSGYVYYGGRGITVCDEWHDYIAFREWALTNGYREGLEIDRVDNNGNYEPNNCRWVPRIINANNKSNNLKITIGDETKTVAEWSRDIRCTVTYGCLIQRISKGWNPERAVFAPGRKMRGNRP